MTFMVELTPKAGRHIKGLDYLQQKHILTDLVAEGVALNYAESADKEKFWVIMTAFSEDEILEILSDLPSLKHLNFHVVPLFTFQSNPKLELVYSLN